MFSKIEAATARRNGEKMKYTFNAVVTPHDLDINNIASSSSVLRYMQEAAYRHLTVCPPTMDELRAENKVFVLSRLSFSIYDEIRFDDKLEISTWPSESKGVSFPRSTRVRRNGDIVAELVSVWALIDPVKKTLWKADAYNPDFEYEEPIELDLPVRLRIPSDVTLSLVGEHTVAYQDVDLNRHLNNTHYPDLICGFLPSMMGKRVVQMAINYLHEAPLGETLKVYISKEDDGVFYVRTVLHDGSVNVEAQIVTEEIAK